jgi:hypothetical protein
MTARPIDTSAREIPSTPDSAVKTARTQCTQLIPVIVAVVTMGTQYTIQMPSCAAQKVSLQTVKLRIV